MTDVENYYIIIKLHYKTTLRYNCIIIEHI